MKPDKRAFTDHRGKAVTAIRFDKDGDHPAVKRAPFRHPWAKGFYLSAGGLQSPLIPGDWIVTDEHGNHEVVKTKVIESFKPEGKS